MAKTTPEQKNERYEHLKDLVKKKKVSNLVEARAELKKKFDGGLHPGEIGAILAGEDPSKALANYQAKSKESRANRGKKGGRGAKAKGRGRRGPDETGSRFIITASGEDVVLYARKEAEALSQAQEWLMAGKQVFIYEQKYSLGVSRAE